MRAVAVTLDIHSGEESEAIVNAHSTLRGLGFRPTYFLPTALLTDSRMRTALRVIDDGSTEIGTHGHHHDAPEIAALSTTRGSLEFLTDSTRRYEEFFHRAPRAFRSPFWCGLAPRTLDVLQTLGYRVDSSATPQRLGLLSSDPFRSPWLTAPRSPRLVRPTLLEVPTTSFVIPFGSLSIALFRKWASLALASAFTLETIATRAVLTIQLHGSDFAGLGSPRAARTWRDLIPMPGRGIAARHWLLDLEPSRMRPRVLNVLESFTRSGLRPMTLSDVYELLTGAASIHRGATIQRSAESRGEPGVAS